MGQILGVDYGERRIGLAISDQTKTIAFPYMVIENESLNFIIDFLKKLCIEEEIESLVIGLPLALSGKDTLQTEKVREFSRNIKILGLPVFLQDERLSSLSAKKSLIKEKIKTGHNKEKIDERAAAIFLQQFLDMNN